MTLVLWALLLIASCGSLGKDSAGPVDRGVCDDYLACAELLGEPVDRLSTLYGDGGICWDSEDPDQAERCRLICEQELSAWVDEYPAKGVCLEPEEPTSPYPEGGWPYDWWCSDADLEASGSEVGEVTWGTRLQDQFGQDVNIHDFCAHHVLIVGATAAMDFRWESLNEVAQRWPDKLVVVVDLRWGETDHAATVEDAAKLASTYGLDLPVLADRDDELYDRFCTGTVPCLTMLDTGAQVLVIDDPDLLDHLEDYLD